MTGGHDLVRQQTTTKFDKLFSTAEIYSKFRHNSTNFAIRQLFSTYFDFFRQISSWFDNIFRLFSTFFYNLLSTTFFDLFRQFFSSNFDKFRRFWGLICSNAVEWCRCRMLSMSILPDCRMLSCRTCLQLFCRIMQNVSLIPL